MHTMGYSGYCNKTKWVAIGWGTTAVSAAFAVCFWVWCSYAYQTPINPMQFDTGKKSVHNLDHRLAALEKFAHSLHITIDTKPKAGIGE